MRNDLGRVCEPGTVQVIEGRMIESHPTVHHGVGEIHGRLHADVGLPELLGATFPPGSITGAPKIRAMQIIRDLEPFDRGPYCGAMGWLTRRDACLSVGIRTLALNGRFHGGFSRFEGMIHYGTGGGIVSDSTPQDEFRETQDKAAVFDHLVDTPTSC
jgi:para-aminobenzoate synthetase component 1